MTRRMSALAAVLAALASSCKRPPADQPAPTASPPRQSPKQLTVAPALPPPAAIRPVDEGPPPPRGTLLSLIYSSNLHGEYEPCG